MWDMCRGGACLAPDDEITGIEALEEAELQRFREEEEEEEKLKASVVPPPEPDVQVRGAEVEEKLNEQAQISDELRRAELIQEYKATLLKNKALMHQSSPSDILGHGAANRYGTPGASRLPHFDTTKHVPTLALLNKESGAKAGADILSIARAQPYYKDNFFNIIDVVRSHERGGIHDIFREQLQLAKDQAKKMGVRPRLISGGGDGTASFALHTVFRALQADNQRADDGLMDTGNGFIWTDEEMRDFFPALAQMPLGSANDLGNILGWGRKFPGYEGGAAGARHSVTCSRRVHRLKHLQDWIGHVINPDTTVSNFDVWGIMPKHGEDTCNFKLAELTGKRGYSPKAKGQDGEMHVLMKEAGLPVPFFVCLYFSAGFMAYCAARFQINRHDTHLKNDLEYVRQGAAIVLGRTPPELSRMCENIKVDCDGTQYFPPRVDKGNHGGAYRDVGFYNINWQAHILHGADRASLSSRMCSGSSRAPVKFNDGLLDVWRFRLRSILKNPGIKLQVDKKKDFKLTYDGGQGKGIFFQWDGESRFAFNPDGAPFDIYIRKVLNIPVVMGPLCSRKLTGDLDNGNPVTFDFCGDTPEDREQVMARVMKSLDHRLMTEMNASKAEIRHAGIPVAEDQWSSFCLDNRNKSR